MRIPHIRRYNSGRSFLPRPKKRGFGQLLILGPRLSSVQVPVTAIAIEERGLGVRRGLRQPRLHSGLNPEMLPKLAIVYGAPLPLAATDRSATSWHVITSVGLNRMS